MHFVIGADTCREDPLIQLKLSIRRYPEIVKTVDVANKVCDGKLLVELGGGYNVKPITCAFYLVTVAIAEVQKVKI